MRTFLVFTLVATSSACDIYFSGDGEGGGGGNDDAGQGEPRLEEVATVSFAPIDDLDILFVIDNSGSMGEEQASLTQSFNNLVNVLSDVGDGLPNVHIGVVSTDVGAGPFNISGCDGDGDSGVLQSAPRGPCDPPSGAFISDIANPDGSRSRNYNGDLVSVFSCISRLGIDGCGFEQPLESMRRALDGSNPSNAGFLRADAHLAIVFVGDEDDCSAFDRSMYDTSSTTVSDPLGPLSSFRCFEFGIECAQGNDDPRAPGERTGCAPRRDSPFMPHTSEYVDFLMSLKSDPGRIFVGGIIGDPTPVVVGTNDMNNPDLMGSCVSEVGEADPGIRLAAFIDAFAGRSDRATICNGNQGDALRSIGDALSQQTNQVCLPANIADASPETPGTQASCEVVDLGPPETELPRCNGDASNAPCFAIGTDPLRCNTSSSLALTVYRAAAPATTSTIRVSCVVR